METKLCILLPRGVLPGGWQFLETARQFVKSKKVFKARALGNAKVQLALAVPDVLVDQGHSGFAKAKSFLISWRNGLVDAGVVLKQSGPFFKGVQFSKGGTTRMRWIEPNL